MTFAAGGEIRRPVRLRAVWPKSGGLPKKEEAPMPVVASYVYRDGQRERAAPLTPEGLALQPGEFVWIGLHDPTDAEFEVLVRRFNLHPLAVEDALSAHQMPKVEVYGRELFVVARTAEKIEDAVSGRKEIDADVLEELEYALITADIGSKTTSEILERIRQRPCRNRDRPLVSDGAGNGRHRRVTARPDQQLHRPVAALGGRCV